MAAMQRQADLKTVLKAIEKYDSKQCAASARTMLREGLPFATPVSAAAPEGASAAAKEVHSFQSQFVEYIEKHLSVCQSKAGEDGAAEAGKIDQAGAELESLRGEVEKAQQVLEDAISILDSKKAHITELEAKVASAEVTHEKYDKKADKQKFAWNTIRQNYESAKAVEEGALRMLDDDEGDEELRSDAATGVVSFIQEQGAEKVLLAAAPLALTVPPSKRRRFDRMASEAVSSLLKKRVAELGESVTNMEPEEKQLKAEIAGLWAISDCARDDVTEAQIDLSPAVSTRAASEAAKKDALNRVKEHEALVKGCEAAKDSAAAREQELAEALAALQRLAKPSVDEPECESAEPEAKRQRLESEA